MKPKIVLIICCLISSTATSASHLSMYDSIGKKYGVPKEVLYALSLTESGITTKQGMYIPWPYTLNWRQKGYRFQNKASACKALGLILSTSDAVDIGESQLHWKYHKDRVDNPCDYLNSEIALRRTSQVLKDCYKKTRNWVSAAGCYHRPAGGKLAQQYMRRFSKNLKRVLGQ